MRRAAPTIPVSPKLLKHFAVVTVVLTAALAMFADEGSRSAIEGEIKDRQDYNEARAIEAQKLGPRKLAGGLNDNRGDSGFGGEEAGPSGGSGSYGGGSRQAPRGPRSQEAGLVPPPNLPMQPGATVTVRSGPYDDLALPEVTSGNKPKKKQPYRPDAKAIEEIQQVSKQRSGNPNGND
ncbi:MAG TPA: hypothetical protein PK479_05955 [Novosphingobium sp.]|nr:hypothetical protein [Novosphingobium sp.]HNN55219.1 hypothetical protein [Novosphingobium sp.]